MVGRRKFGKKKRLDAPCAPAEERPAVFFGPFPPPPFRLFYPLPQKFVDLSSQIIIKKTVDNHTLICIAIDFRISFSMHLAAYVANFVPLFFL
ncbi:hypothetical protein HMPREF0083_04747 [Aneurinibacillus aneurinilyticus ATCC 12856]|uniref:Uncharacterized protein n=1 Tax=Aneurinibacillus aneurinilyticus ATCC 12856 TaxID=649747 RepID=U1WF37_ANEAE|nr:hypothetical protein HMPREF0083_04747 [Aneurinibacillus aneurinilyticus ATCC 12856]